MVSNFVRMVLENIMEGVSDKVRHFPVIGGHIIFKKYITTLTKKTLFANYTICQVRTG